MRKFYIVALLVATGVAMILGNHYRRLEAITIRDNSATGTGYESIDKPTPVRSNYKDPSQGTPVGPNDDPGPGQNTNVGVSADTNGFWLPPEDSLSDEEKEFRNKVIEAAQLDRDDPEFEEKLTAIYAATRSDEFPNYKTYRLFIDRLEANEKTAM